MAKKYMSKASVLEAAHNYFPEFLSARREAKILGAWVSGNQYTFTEEADLDSDEPGYGQAYAPNKREITEEYENLRGLAPNNFGGLLVTTLSQLACIEGISRPGATGTLPVWKTFRQNRWGSRQSAIHRAAIGQAVAYGVVLPGKDPLTGAPMARMIGKSPERMAAFYQDEDDEWPVFAIEGDEVREKSDLGPVAKTGWIVKFYDAHVTHRISCKGDGAEKSDWEYIDYEEHSVPVPPIARCANRLDLEGHATGEIEPVLPLLRRIDQDMFDRLINQRFGAWQVRYIAGMAKPSSESAQAAQSLRMRVEDLLISTNEKTKFGVLPGGDIKAQIEATDHDLRLLSAISQTPPHHLLGLSSNLQAEALAAATEGLQRKAFEFRQNAGEFHEQMARLVAMVEGDMAMAAAWDLRVRWRDTESASMTQAADALGKFATQLNVPVEMLWERIPNWTDDDVQRAKELVENGSIMRFFEELTGDEQEQEEEEGPTGGNPQ